MGFKVRDTENIPCNKLEEIVKNVRKIENPNLTEEKLKSKMESIKKFNNMQFSKCFTDPRLLFKISLKNYTSIEQYPKLLEKIKEIYQSKSSDKRYQTTIKFINGQYQQILYKLEALSGDEKKILMDYTFDFGYDFINKFMNPFIQIYAENFSYDFSKISKPEYLNLNIRSYIVSSEDESILNIIDGNLEYLNKLDSYLKANSKQVIGEKKR